MQLPFFERDADALLTALVRAGYLERSGRQPTLPLSSIYERFADVYSLDTYEQLLDLEVDERIGGVLQRFVLEHYLAAAMAERDQQRALDERLTIVEWDFESIPLRTARQLLGQEDDPVRRHDLDERIRQAERPLAGARLDRLMAARVALQPIAQYDLPVDDLGFSRLVADVAVEDVSALAERVLEATADLYYGALRDQLAHYGLDPENCWEVDLAWILRGEEYERVYPRQLLVPSIVRAVFDLDIRLQDQTQIRLDVEALPGKVGESFCAPIAVPDEIVVMLATRGALADYLALFRGVGEAERHAHADRSQPLAYRRLGDDAVVAGYGHVLASLLGHPDWLALRLEAEATRDAVRLHGFEQLYGLRKAAASHLFEVEARSAPEPDGLEDRYAELFAVALGVTPFATRMLAGFEAPFSGACQLRAAIFGQQLRTFLEREFDEEWYRSSRAGRFLVDRWREGQRYRAEELVRFLGFEGLDVAPLIAELRSALTD